MVEGGTLVASAAPQHPSGGQSGGRRRGVLRLSVVILVLGLALTTVLSALCYVVNERAESRLLALETKQAAATLELALPTVQTPLTSAAEIAEASDGNPAHFRRYLASYVEGARAQFASVSLWRLAGATARPVTALGAAAPAVTPGLVRFIRSAIGEQTPMQVLGRLHGNSPALWYAVTARTPAPRFAVFAVAMLPTNRRSRLRRGQAFSELHFAIYLGPTTRKSQLISSDTAGVPPRGGTSRATIPFGNTSLTFVATPAQRLSGTLSAWMWWLVAIFAGCGSVAAAITAEWLVRRRKTAEALRSQVETLLTEQRGISESLQRALLPKALPRVAGAEVAARYVPGTFGTEVGGDWYDVVLQGDARLFFVIGDVSGRGIQAASVMASLRFAIRGFVSEGHSPAAVLTSTSRLLDLRTDRHFATVLCGSADLRARELTFASAGHLLPLLVTDGSVAMADGIVGPPIGVAPGSDYSSVTIPLPHVGMLLFFTDGLVERRGEDLDQGLARLVAAVSTDGHGGVADQLDALIRRLVPEQASDDTAVVGVRWT